MTNREHLMNCTLKEFYELAELADMHISPEPDENMKVSEYLEEAGWDMVEFLDFCHACKCCIRSPENCRDYICEKCQEKWLDRNFTD